MKLDLNDSNCLNEIINFIKTQCIRCTKSVPLGFEENQWYRYKTGYKNYYFYIKVYTDDKKIYTNKDFDAFGGITKCFDFS